jgi:hypothetical protein
MKWQPGQSGNPKGKPKGEGEVAKLRASIAQHLPDIIEAMVEQAKGGDAQAARLLLERVCPSLRPVDMPTVMNLPADGSLADQGRAVLLALASGQLPVNQATGILQALAGLAKLIETDELERRISVLEGRHAQP